MKIKLLAAFLCAAAMTAFAADRPDFSGSWQLEVAKSQNLGMMSQMQMTLKVRQTDTALDITTHTLFQGQDTDTQTHYDLTGKPASNEMPMTGVSETVSKWEGPKLVTTWTSENAVAGGAKVVRTETRTLSSDGKTMTVESQRGSTAPIVMVFGKM
jgi:hypothetical protein